MIAGAFAPRRGLAFTTTRSSGSAADAYGSLNAGGGADQSGDGGGGPDGGPGRLDGTTTAADASAALQTPLTVAGLPLLTGALAIAPSAARLMRSALGRELGGPGRGITGRGAAAAPPKMIVEIRGAGAMVGGVGAGGRVASSVVSMRSLKENGVSVRTVSVGGEWPSGRSSESSAYDGKLPPETVSGCSSSVPGRKVARVCTSFARPSSSGIDDRRIATISSAVIERLDS